MQRNGWLIVIGALCLVAPLIRADAPTSTVLAEDDYEMERLSREDGPALSSEIGSKNPWESYNEWRCFPTKAVELSCVEIEYGGERRRSPTIGAVSDDHRFEYDLDPTFRWDCEFTLNEWREVIGTSPEVCLFGAHLQPLEEGASLWVLSDIKSQDGYWEEYESKAYARATRDSNDLDDEEAASE